MRKRTAPFLSSWVVQRCCRPRTCLAPVDRPLSFATAVARSLAPSVYLVPSSHPPPFVLLHVSCVLLAQESTAKPSPLVSVRRCMNQAVPRRVSPIVS